MTAGLAICSPTSTAAGRLFSDAPIKFATGKNATCCSGFVLIDVTCFRMPPWFMVNGGTWMTGPVSMLTVLTGAWRALERSRLKVESGPLNLGTLHGAAVKSITPSGEQCDLLVPEDFWSGGAWDDGAWLSE